MAEADKDVWLNLNPIVPHGVAPADPIPAIPSSCTPFAMGDDECPVTEEFAKPAVEGMGLVAPKTIPPHTTFTAHMISLMRWGGVGGGGSCVRLVRVVFRIAPFVGVSDLDRQWINLTGGLVGEGPELESPVGRRGCCSLYGTGQCSSMISAEYRAAWARIGAQLRRLTLYEDGTEGLPLFVLEDQLEDGTEGGPVQQHPLVLLRATRLKNRWCLCFCIASMTSHWVPAQLYTLCLAAGQLAWSHVQLSSLSWQIAEYRILRQSHMTHDPWNHPRIPPDSPKA